MLDFTLVLYHFKFKNSLYGRFMNPGMGIIGEFLLQYHHFLPKQVPTLEENCLALWLVWPKTQVCMIVGYFTLFQSNISSLSRFMNPRMEIIDVF